jgi:hypothetical protein
MMQPAFSVLLEPRSIAVALRHTDSVTEPRGLRLCRFAQVLRRDVSMLISRSMEMSITTAHNLLTQSWTADVKTLEIAIRQLTSRRLPANDCRVALFEVAGDRDLHVNVTHRHKTAAVKGWAGPAALPQGFVHNRTFGDMPPKAIVRRIREMVFSARF